MATAAIWLWSKVSWPCMGALAAPQTTDEVHTQQAMAPEEMLKWADTEPWNADVGERYFYTMSKMMDKKASLLLLAALALV
jgi:hypothetical protein